MICHRCLTVLVRFFRTYAFLLDDWSPQLREQGFARDEGEVMWEKLMVLQTILQRLVPNVAVFLEVRKHAARLRQIRLLKYIGMPREWNARRCGVIDGRVVQANLEIFGFDWAHTQLLKARLYNTSQLRHGSPY